MFREQPMSCTGGSDLPLRRLAYSMHSISCVVRCVFDFQPNLHCESYTQMIRCTKGQEVGQ